MTQTLFIFIDPGSGAPAYAGLVDAAGAARRQAEIADFYFTEPEAERTVLVLPGEAVVTHRAPLPPGSDAQARTAAGFTVEDMAARPVDELHIAIGPEEGAGRRLAILDKGALQGWLDAAAALGVTPDSVVADYDLIPREDGAISVAMIGGRVFVTGPGTGFTADPDLSAAILKQALEGARLGPVWSEDSGALGPLAPVLENAGQAPRDDGADYAALIAAGLRGGAYTELLQGAFARRAPFFAQWRVFTRSAALLAVAVLGGVGLLAAEGFALNQRADEIRAEAESVFAEGFPEETRIVNPRLQMTTRLRALRSAGSGAFLDLATILTGSLEDISSARVQSMRYDAETGELVAEVEYAAFEDMETLRANIAARGAELEEGVSRQSQGRIASEIVVRTP